MGSRSNTVEMYRKTGSVAQVAQELGIQENSVRRALQRAGLFLRGPLGQDDATEVKPTPTWAHCHTDLAHALAALEVFFSMSGELKDFAETFAHDFEGEVTGELLLAAKRLKGDLSDALFHFRLALPLEARAEYEKLRGSGKKSA